MEKKEILQSLYKYKKTEFTCKFLEKTIEYFEELPDIIYKLTDNAKLLAGVRIHLLYKKYHIYLLDYLIEDKCSRELKLSQKAANNLINQFDGIKRNSMIICNKLTTDKLHVYLTISENIIEHEDELVTEMWLPLIGIHSLYFLEHQNLDHYCSMNVINNTKPILDTLEKVLKKVKSFDNLYRDRFLIFSGLIAHFFGAIYTADIDAIIIGKNNEDVNKYKSKIEYIDEIASTVPDEYDTNNSYKEKFFKYILPQLGNAENIYEILINPEQHFYFNGFKCLNLFTNLKREISRSHPFSFLDFIMLKKMNNIDKIQDFCLKNIIIRQGQARIINDKNDIPAFYKIVIKYLKLWYNLDVENSHKKTMNFFNKNVIKCTKKYGTIYRPSDILYKDPLIKKETILHRKILQNYIYEYGKKLNSLLDVGSGKLLDSKIYIKMNIKEMYGIEPSKESLQIARETVSKLKKQGYKINFKLFHGFGDQPFPFKKQFDIITFIFTIHYMISNLDKVIENINNSSKTGTKIIITCINGMKLLNELKKNDKYEIRHNNDIMWGVYKYNDSLNIKLPKVLFFMKDVYGLENGSEEHVVNIEDLITNFSKNNIKLELRKTFLDEYNQHKYKYDKEIEDFQKKILDVHEILIFNKL